MLGIKQTIPDIEFQALLPAGQFTSLRLSDFRGRWLVLFFWPLDFTFVCPTEIRAYNRLVPEFEKIGTALLGASVDSVYTHKAWCANGLGPVDFPMIGDVTRRLAKGFGVLLNEEGVAARASFIIDPHGVVMSASVNGLDVGRSAAETLRLLQAFQTGGLTACEWQPGQALLQD
jgi:alkyl hydroperoxide reductase subunit AhpC